MVSPDRAARRDGARPRGHDRITTRRIQTISNGAHVAVVEVDADTGVVHLRRLVVVHDCGHGRSIPLIVDGQIHGGAAQGIGQALAEAARYDDGGQLLTGSLMDYALPRADYDARDVRLIHL